MKNNVCSDVSLLTYLHDLTNAIPSLEPIKTTDKNTYQDYRVIGLLQLLHSYILSHSHIPRKGAAVRVGCLGKCVDHVLGREVKRGSV